MPNAAYRNAANQERRVKAKLEADGWTCWRTPGSKSPADLVCLRRGGLVPYALLVQCKNGARSMGPKARREFGEFAADIGASALLVERGMKFRRISPTGEYADENEAA